MADKKTTAAAANIPAPSPASTKAVEAEYSIQELAAAAHTIAEGATPDSITAALRLAGLTKASKSKAAELVTKFNKKEVK